MLRPEEEIKSHAPMGEAQSGCRSGQCQGVQLGTDVCSSG